MARLAHSCHPPSPSLPSQLLSSWGSAWLWVPVCPQVWQVFCCSFCSFPTRAPGAALTAFLPWEPFSFLCLFIFNFFFLELCSLQCENHSMTEAWEVFVCFSFILLKKKFPKHLDCRDILSLSKDWACELLLGQRSARPGAGKEPGANCWGHCSLPVPLEELRPFRGRGGGRAGTEERSHGRAGEVQVQGGEGTWASHTTCNAALQSFPLNPLKLLDGERQYSCFYDYFKPLCKVVVVLGRGC